MCLPRVSSPRERIKIQRSAMAQEARAHIGTPLGAGSEELRDVVSPTYRGRHRQPARGAQQASALLPGQRLIGRYRLGDRTSPADPVTFRAEDLLLGRPVVITFVNLDSDVADLIYGSGEDTGVSGLQHPCLARLLDVGHEPEVLQSFVVSDYLSDTSVADELAGGGVSADELRVVLREVSRLVGFLAAAGFGHRGLHPDNVRVGRPSGPAPGVRVQVGLAGLYGKLSRPRDDATDAAVARPSAREEVMGISQIAKEGVRAGVLRPPGTRRLAIRRLDEKDPWSRFLAAMLAVDSADQSSLERAETALFYLIDRGPDPLPGHAAATPHPAS
jgi:hypothetical protein